MPSNRGLSKYSWVAATSCSKSCSPDAAPAARLAMCLLLFELGSLDYRGARRAPEASWAIVHGRNGLSPRLPTMSIDRAALAVGGIRLASGISFLVDPLRANKLWGSPDKPDATAQLLLRSMGYRDALIGG